MDIQAAMRSIGDAERETAAKAIVHLFEMFCMLGGDDEFKSWIDELRSAGFESLADDVQRVGRDEQ